MTFENLLREYDRMYNETEDKIYNGKNNDSRVSFMLSSWCYETNIN